VANRLIPDDSVIGNQLTATVFAPVGEDIMDLVGVVHEGSVMARVTGLPTGLPPGWRLLRRVLRPGKVRGWRLARVRRVLVEPGSELLNHSGEFDDLRLGCGGAGLARGERLSEFGDDCIMPTTGHPPTLAWSGVGGNPP